MESTVKKKAVRKKAATRQLKTIKNTELQHADQLPAQLSPIEQMQQMHEMGISVDDMKGMLALQREYEKDQAIKAFNLALSEFKAEKIEVYKRGKVEYENNDNSKTGYSHAKLEDVVDIAVPFLSKHGFSHRWRPEQLDGGVVRIVLVLTHKAGHSEETPLQAGLDQSGGKNNIQALGSTVSYLERYTFLAGTGIAVKDMDDDGVAAGAVAVDLISETQLADMQSLIEEVGSTNEAFAKHCRLESLDKMPLSKYKAAIEVLNARKEQMK